LPTEAEWELSASGYDRMIYPWGNQWDDQKLYWGGTETGDYLLPVGSFRQSNQGFYDLAGSVSEWTSTADESGNYGLIKGASRYENNIANIRSAVRRIAATDYSGEDVGFRCAKSLDEWPMDAMQAGRQTTQLSQHY